MEVPHGQQMFQRQNDLRSEEKAVSQIRPCMSPFELVKLNTAAEIVKYLKTVFG